LDKVRAQIPDVTISIIGETREPVPSSTDSSAGVATSYLQPTYAIDEDPELDVLRMTASHSPTFMLKLILGAVIPGGPGSRYAYNNPAIIDYVKRTYPKLQYILSVCTGAQVLAKAGILDGKRATTSKFAWREMVASGPSVDWVRGSIQRERFNG
jgi:transcriptional regulator GlxA family with amidase domain